MGRGESSLHSKSQDSESYSETVSNNKNVLNEGNQQTIKCGFFFLFSFLFFYVGLLKLQFN